MVKAEEKDNLQAKVVQLEVVVKRKTKVAEGDVINFVTNTFMKDKSCFTLFD